MRNWATWHFSTSKSTVLFTTVCKWFGRSENEAIIIIPVFLAHKCYFIEILIPLAHTRFSIRRHSNALVERGYVLYQGKELKLQQDTHTKLLAFKEQRQGFWIWVPALQEFAVTKDSHDSFSAEMAAKGPFDFQVFLHWGCAFYHQDCFRTSKNLQLALQVAVIAWEVILLLVRKWVFYIHWLLLIYNLLPMDVP